MHFHTHYKSQRWISECVQGERSRFQWRHNCSACVECCVFV